MGSTPLVVGIDCGSQSAKVVVVDASGRVHAHAQVALRPMHRPAPGVVVHPDDDLWRATSEACRLAMGQLGERRGEIVAAGLCPIRCCKAFLRSDGSLAEPVISWMDDRAYRPYQPGAASGTAYATSASGYLGMRLTGERRDTVANLIPLQWPIDPRRRAWIDDDAELERQGLARSQLFELVVPGEVLGALSDEAAAETGLLVGIPIVATANDKAVEMLGVGATSPGTVLVSLGTYIAAMTPGDEYVADGEHVWTNFACHPTRYLYESTGIRRGMWTVSWFLDLLGPEFAAAAAAAGVSREAYIEAEAAAAPPGSDGLVAVLDWLAPTDHPFRKGSFLGFDARHGRGHTFRSIIEAIAVTMRLNVESMCAELDRTVDELVVSGGGSTSALVMQVFADVFGLPASCTAGERGASGAGLGAAMCAAVGAGLHDDLDAAAAAMAPARRSFRPDVATRDVYDSLAGIVSGVRASTDPVYRRTFPIFH